MATPKIKKVKCKVVRAFFIEGKEVPVLIDKKPNIIELEEPFALEMKGALKVEFIEPSEEKETKPAGGTPK